MPAGTFGHARVILCIRGYFCKCAGTFSYMRVLLSPYRFFWADAGTFGRAQVLLGAPVFLGVGRYFLSVRR